ncbi:hypothetical protein ABTM58_20955, partial [Acinetobacter baumannii]
MLANGLVQPKQNGHGQGQDGNGAEGGEAQGEQPFAADGNAGTEQVDPQAEQPVIAEAPQPEEVTA